jgi:hypothetical protein
MFHNGGGWLTCSREFGETEAFGEGSDGLQPSQGERGLQGGWGLRGIDRGIFGIGFRGDKGVDFHLVLGFGVVVTLGGLGSDLGLRSFRAGARVTGHWAGWVAGGSSRVGSNWRQRSDASVYELGRQRADGVIGFGHVYDCERFLCFEKKVPLIDRGQWHLLESPRWAG